MEKGRKFVIGDLVSHCSSSATASNSGSDIGVIVSHEVPQGKMSFIYRVRWIEPYAVFDEMVYEDEVYENNLVLLSRV